MVYKRRRKTYKKRSSGASVKKLIRRELSRKLELKWSIVNDIRANLSSTPFAVNPFDYIYTPTSSLNMGRIGNSVDCTGLMLRAFVDGADTPFNRVRILILSTREQLPVNLLGGSYNATTCFDPVFSTQGTNSPVDRQIVSRVYMDRTINLQRNVDGVGLTGANVVKTCNKFLKRHQKVMYNGETTSSDDVGTKLQSNLYLVMFSDSAAIPHPQITYSLKTFYTDG